MWRCRNFDTLIGKIRTEATTGSRWSLARWAVIVDELHDCNQARNYRPRNAVGAKGQGAPFTAGKKLKLRHWFSHADWRENAVTRLSAASHTKIPNFTIYPITAPRLAVVLFSLCLYVRLSVSVSKGINFWGVECVTGEIEAVRFWLGIRIAMRMREFLRRNFFPLPDRAILRFFADDSRSCRRMLVIFF